MRLLRNLVFLLVATATTVLAAGNETINPVPDSNKSTFRVDSQNFWKNEIPQILHKYVSKDFVFSGGIHSVSGTCTSPSFSLEGFTNIGNRVTATNVAVNYGAANIGGNCASDVCWVAASGSDAAAFGNFKQSGTSNIYVDCLDTNEPTWPSDTIKLMKVTLNGGSITSVLDLRGSASSANSGIYNIADSPYNAVCDGVADTAPIIQKLLDSAPEGSTIKLPTGICQTNTTIHINRQMVLQGAHMELTTLRSGAADQPVVSIHTINVKVLNMSVKHSGTAIAGGDGLVVVSPGFGLNIIHLDNITANSNWRGFVLGCVAYSQGENLWAAINNHHGFEFVYEPTCGAAQWGISNSISQLNKGAGFAGFNDDTAVGIGPWLSKVVTFGNNLGGYVFYGTPGKGIYDLRLEGVLSSADNLAGMYLDTYGSGHIISDPWIELTGTVGGFGIGTPSTPMVATNTGNCLALTANNSKGIIVKGGLYWNCAWSGVALYAPYSGIDGGSSIGNGRALSTELAQRAGVAIGASGVMVTGHSFNYNSTETLHYIHLTGTLSEISIGHNAYDVALPTSAIIGSTAYTPGGRYATFVAGLNVNTNSPTAPAFSLLDASGGVNPLKFFRVTNGNLVILNSASSAVIQSLSDAGTPNWPSRGGTATIVDANSTANVGLVPNEPDTNYRVQVTADSSVSGPAAGAFIVIGINKATTGFELAVSAPPGAGKSVTYNWLVYRSN